MLVVSSILLFAAFSAAAYTAYVLYQRNSDATVIADTRKRIAPYLDWPGWREKLIHGETNV